MFRFDPKLDETYVGNIIKTHVSSNICFSFDPTLSISSIYAIISTIYYHVMSLGVTLGYPKMVCSQDFRVYRHVMIRRLVRNARKSSNPVLRNLSRSYTNT